jgi:mannitol-1-phosphate 5-dehydrogenase
MSEAREEPALLALARAAFVEESGRALCRKYAGLDALFTEAGYAAYVDDLLERMLNPHLRDAVERVTRDPRRKLGWQDRLVGTMRLALAHGIAPRGYALGAAAALRALQAEAPGKDAAALLDEVWAEAVPPAAERQKVRDLILNAAHPA